MRDGLWMDTGIVAGAATLLVTPPAWQRASLPCLSLFGP